MLKIKKIESASCAKIFAFIYGVVGVLIGIFFFALVVSGEKLPDGIATFLGGDITELVGVSSIFIFPLLYAGAGFVGGLLTAWVFNFGAKWAGGLKIEVEESAKDK